MIGILDNAKHQLTVAGTGMIAEAHAGAVDVTGFRLLDAPDVAINADGSITLRIVVPDSTSKRAAKINRVEPEETPEEGNEDAVKFSDQSRQKKVAPSLSSGDIRGNTILEIVENSEDGNPVVEDTPKA